MHIRMVVCQVLPGIALSMPTQLAAQGPAPQIRTSEGVRYVGGRGKLIFDDEATRGAQLAESTVDTDPKATPWNIAVEQLGDSVKGRITTSGPDAKEEGTIEATISGSTVSGTVHDTAGRKIATFEGTLAQRRFSGKFRTVGGRVGSWAWDGLPQ